VWVAILAFTILVIATNAGLIGISRLSFSLATNDLMPSVFGSLHAKYRTPWVSIVVFAIAGAGLVLPGLLVSDRVINLMAAVYSLAATFAFCAAHLAVMRLRFVEPELHRPYQMPLNVKFGRSSIPVLSLVGALAIGTVFSQLMQENITGSSFIFIGWLVVGVLAFVAYRRHRGQPLWEPLETPPPPDREVEHGPIEPLPRSERVRMGRRQKIAGQVALPLPHPAHRQHRTRWLGLQLLVLRHGRLRATLGILVFAAISGLAIGVDLSRFDPFGPALQWSPGVVFVTLVAAYLLARSRAER
jgi:Amino acid permease